MNKMKLFQKNELKTLWPFYLENILGYLFALFPAFMIVYFVSIGFSLTQVGLLISTWAFFTLIFEIPTGAIADLYGRKFSVLLGYCLEGILIISFMFSTNFYFVFCVFALWGLASTLSSGSKEAWVVDLIRHKKGKFETDFFIKQSVIMNFALIISGIVGALLVKEFGIVIIWPVSGITFFISIGILLFAPEHHIKRKIKIKQSFKKLWGQSKKSISYSSKHPVLFYILLAGFILSFAGAFAGQLSWITLLQELGMKDYWFGYMLSGMCAFAGIAPLFSKWFLKRNSEKKAIIKLILITSFLIFFVYFAKTLIFALGILFISEFFFKLRHPIERVYFHKFIPKKLRATIGSVESMILSLAGIISLPLVGYLIDTIGPKYVIMISAVLLIPASLTYLMIKEEKA